TVWAPLLKDVAVRLLSPVERTIPMEQDDKGYWNAVGEGVSPGSLYFYRLENSAERPDPASRLQPRGVHGPSQVVDPGAFPWDDSHWRGIPPKDFIIYELHIGTFTEAGTFEAAISHLDYLKDLGITAIELMPIAQFPGNRNWGYDGAYPFAPQNSYGGPEGLKAFINASHQKGMAVILDVVYNHLGPEGNYLGQYGPYFTDRYRTPWGDAINFDGPYSDGVREFWIANALYWMEDYHIDSLRLDAVHGIFDFSAKHFLQELGEAVHRRAEELGREVSVIPESNLNDVRVITPVELGGHGLDAQWNDDFHHCLHTLLTGERTGYYEDFGKMEYLEKALREGFVYSGEYSAFRKRKHGNSSKDRPARQFAVFSQNHDQVGNRMRGDRSSKLVSFEGLKLSAGIVLLSPYIPLLFMGEEYGEDNPFLYFVSHGDAALVEAVRRGRREEFGTFAWEGEPPDPQAVDTFLRSRPDWRKRESGRHRNLLDLYRSLIRLRKETPALAALDKNALEVSGESEHNVIILRRWKEESHVLCIFNFSDREATIRLPLPDGRWSKILDSSHRAWDGPGMVLPDILASNQDVRIRAFSFAVFRKEELF
ncbi:MAG: malto-oligosyltrehalose trehalohydrolase, partial [bacterium]